VAAFIRTVLGDIDPAQLGACYSHEHIIIDPGFATLLEPDFCLDSVELAAAELGEVYRAGGRAMIDTMPCDCGRNVLKLAEVSRRSGVHIVCPTGLHLQKYYPPGHWSLRMDEAALARLFADEIALGMDANDCGGPVLERTNCRAGVIKVAGGRDRLSAHERKVFGAAARAHVQTGCPVITHTEQGTAGMEQADVLAAGKADLRRVVLSHTDRLPDVEYHRALLRRGVRLEYDSAFRWKESDGNPTLRLLVELLPEFPRQLLLGMDAARKKYWRSHGGAPGLVFLLTRFSDQLRAAGVAAELIDNLFIRNPAEAYSFGERR
jgi:phosphotriesterase-related protein